MGEVADELRRRLEQALSPERLAIRDDSHHHVGHAGHRPEGETHFFVDVVSARFEGLSRVGRQRLVYQALDDLMKVRVHALSIKARAPGELPALR